MLQYYSATLGSVIVFSQSKYENIAASKIMHKSMKYCKIINVSIWLNKEAVKMYQKLN